MSVTIIRGTNDKPVATELLVKFFRKQSNLTGQLFVGYPIIGTPEGRLSIDALLITPEKGLVIFDLVEGRDIQDWKNRQDQAANLLEAKLKAHRELVKRRDLLIPIQTLTFAPAVSHLPVNQEYLIANEKRLESALDELEEWDPQDANLFDKTLSAIQSISSIRKSRTKRVVEKEDSRGMRLKHLEDSIATLDSQQGTAVVETVEGVQRIRGLAGSGKTIVLALKAAYLHAQHPEWRIAVTFHTRSLKGQFHRLINTFCIEQAGEEPDWENVLVLNAWGAPGHAKRDGIYHQFCRVHDLPYYDFRSARSQARGREFEWACEEALRNTPNPKHRYDAILVDEAQDFPPEFIRLCYEFLRKKKRLVYAYDELQSLSGESLPSPEDIFGKNSDGTPRVRLDVSTTGSAQKDIILPKCYRNSRPVLVTAHALGFGIYRKPPKRLTTGLVQMFDHPNLWEEVGYVVEEGRLVEDSEVTLARTLETSPGFLEEHSPIEDLVQFQSFLSEDEQTDWLVEQIRKNLEEDELRHDDIVVINPDPLTTRGKVGPIRKKLYEIGINSHLAGVDTDPDIFFQTGVKSVTFTGIYRAKGNEAAMVYIVNAQDCQSASSNLASIRNRLFTAMTRSKAWVRVLGIGEAMDRLADEFRTLKRNQFELRFRYPTEEERKKLRMVHRDMSLEERKRLKKRKEGLAGLVQDLEAGIIDSQDLDEDIIQKLETLLMKKK